MGAIRRHRGGSTGYAGAVKIELKEVTCMCGWQTRGTDDEIVAAIQEHGEIEHGRRPSREEILELAVVVGTPAD